jgi:hypothetical protein
MMARKLSDLKSSREIAATESRDPELAAELERTSVAEAQWLARAREPEDRYRPASSITGDE